jgi:hypothetical protein
MSAKKTKQTFTLTFAESGENHKGMQIIGTPSTEGYSLSDLQTMHTWFTNHGSPCELIHLNQLLHGITLEKPVEDAYLLIMRHGADSILQQIHKKSADLYKEMDALPKDSKAFMYGRVVEKRARHNLVFADFDQQPDYADGKGTVVDFKHVPLLDYIRSTLQTILQVSDKEPLICEGNFYYDVAKCGIGFHGDAERFKVIGLRVGETMPLRYSWFYKHKVVGPHLDVLLQDGDMYVMSEKTTGNDWKKNSQYTLRHAAGSASFLSLTKYM